jgi:hypothetical protein
LPYDLASHVCEYILGISFPGFHFCWISEPELPQKKRFGDYLTAASKVTERRQGAGSQRAARTERAEEAEEEG